MGMHFCTRRSLLGTGQDAAVTVVLSPTADAHIISGATLSDYNYGTATIIASGGIFSAVQRAVRGLIQPDISSIPIGAVIVSATLSLYCESEAAAADEDVSAHRALTQWWEGACNGSDPGATDASTWNHRNANSGAPVVWGVAGGLAGTDYTAIATDTVTITASGLRVEWDVAADVQDWVDGTASNYGWWLINSDEASADAIKRFTSSDGAVPANRPTLTVVYT